MHPMVHLGVPVQIVVILVGSLLLQTLIMGVLCTVLKSPDHLISMEAVV